MFAQTGATRAYARARVACPERGNARRSSERRNTRRTARVVVSRRPKLELIAPSASPAEAAAIVAALERFMRETAPRAAAPAGAGLDRWTRTAMLEGVSRRPESYEGDASALWINT
jgi:hypothetical protein